MGIRYMGQSGKGELSLLRAIVPLSRDGKVLKLDSSGSYRHLFTDQITTLNG